MMFPRRLLRVDLGTVILAIGLAWGVSCQGQGVAIPGPQPAAPGKAGGPGAEQDSVKLSFLFLGCNRIQHSDWKAIKEADPSSANLPQFGRTAADIAQLSPIPPYLFFTGDLVVNLESDNGEKLKKQLDAWTDVFNKSPLAGKLTLIPMPGNHEVLQKLDDSKDKDDDDEVEVPNPAANARWVEWLHKSRFDTFAKAANGPRKDHPKSDHLADDQSEMTYSFDVVDVHFVVINTDTLSTVIDPATKHPYSGWVPYHWIEQDVRAAQANPKISAIFLLGHKPLKTPNGGEENSTVLNVKEFPLADNLLTLILANDKVRAYLCAHEHQWDLLPMDKARRAWQVIAGNAGSQLNPAFLSSNPFFGFSQINVYTSGKVGLVSHQRPANPDKKLYIAGPPSPPPPAQPQPEVILHPAP
jgi:Calcineurin-like phosphoesterase